ncbi:MAG: NifB/NifX family molybdenum-iron cluster-binding protein [Candidatus Undinarchaeales archaeon]|nr:NifB/NifX family molybdenum-iron cluster-binding protein [Candidatus Undinarchaeales archaeon]MDP7491794.1 NifB/NifX family molybdenum-iron cluster-binding protein [Candidatus Undinarchaeales archaeon]
MASDLGSAPYILIIDTETMSVDAVRNRPERDGRDPGERAAELIIARNATTVLMGDADPRAVALLESSGAEVRRGHSGTVTTVLERQVPRSTISVDECFCPNCSYAHRRTGARPCFQRKCPQCGSAMDRRWITPYKWGAFNPGQ